jgi:hypothetical protein
VTSGLSLLICYEREKILIDLVLVGHAHLTRSDAMHNYNHGTKRLRVNPLDEGIGDTLV